MAIITYKSISVYTIIPRKNIELANKKAGKGSLIEKKLWVTANSDFKSLETNHQMTLLLADASSIRGVEWIAQIDDIKLDKENGTTKVIFSKLIKLPSVFPLNKIKLRNGQYLSKNHIRPYALSITPKPLLELMESNSQEIGNLKVNPRLKNLQNEPSREIILDVDNEAISIEGDKKLVQHFRRERNSAIIKKKKEQVLKLKGKITCEICNFDFGKVYGKIGDNFCEVHHLTPLAQITESVKTKLSDLIPICSNCHRMIHKLPTESAYLTLKKLFKK